MLVLFLSAYGWLRSWFVALCGAVVLLSVLQHPDMPRAIGGIQGANLWNVLFANIFLAWLCNRSSEGSHWYVPRRLKMAATCYLVVLVVAALRLLMNPSEFVDQTTSQIVVNYLFNPLKFLLPAIMLFDGCRTRERVLLALGAILLTYFLLACMVVRYVGFTGGLMSGDALSRRAARIISRSIGYHRVEMSMMLAGASWAIITYSQYFRSIWIRAGMWSAAAIAVAGMALTAGRGGYISWMAVGLVFCVLKSRKLLILLPAAVALIFAVMPSARERLLHGTGDSESVVVTQADDSEMTSGRTDIWPHVIDKIEENPVIGVGRLGMKTTGLEYFAATELSDVFAHPHNAYLEMLLDGGLVSLLLVLPLYWIVTFTAIKLFIGRHDPLVCVVGGCAAALLVSFLVACLGAQTLYPREGVVLMWAAVGIAMRVAIDASEEEEEWWGDENLSSDEE